MAGMGASGTPDVSIDHASSVGDIQAILRRMVARIDDLEITVGANATGTEQQLAGIRVDIRTIQVQGAASGGMGKRIDLIDTKTMSPDKFSGGRSENFKAWAKKIKAYCNAKLAGYRAALEASEKVGASGTVDGSVMTSWSWPEAVEADARLYDMLLLVTAGEANGIVESVPGRGFEGWRLLNVRYNSVGEMYSYDKMNAIMRQPMVKNIADLPGAIAKFEKDLKTFRERTDNEFPEMLKLPILIQMIPQSWKKEFEAQFRVPGAERTYESLVGQLLAIGNEERYLSGKRGPDDMDTDNLEKNFPNGYSQEERQDMYEGVEPSDREYTSQEVEHWEKLQAEIAQRQEEVNWLGQKGAGKGKGGKYGKGFGGSPSKGWSPGKGSGGKAPAATAGNGKGEPPDMSQVQCLWCWERGHYRRDCKHLAEYKKNKDAERAKRGDHSVYVPPGKGKGGRGGRGVGSLDSDYSMVGGMTGDLEVPLRVLSDDDDDDKVPSSGGDYESASILSGDDFSELGCGICEDQEEELLIGNRCQGECCDEGEAITPPNESEEWRAVGPSTPLADLFRSAREAVSSPTADVCAESPAAATEPTFSTYTCRWEVLSNISEYEQPTTDTTNGSTVGSALRTDEPAMSRVYHHHAQWQGHVAKPACKRGWPRSRRTTRASKEEECGVHKRMWPARRRTPRTSGVETPCLVSPLGIEVTNIGNIQEKNEVIEYEVIDPDIGDGSFEFIESDVEDENVELTEGEIRMRIIQKKDIDLSVAERKERRFKIKRGITADSGAGDPVIPRRMLNPKKIVPSAGSRRGLHYVSATNHRIPNVGEVDLEFETSEGFSEKIKFQVADVNKALMSISDRVDHRCRVVFDQDEETGEDISHIYDKQSRRKLKLARVGKVWVLECSVTEDFLPMNLVPTNNQGFTGPGR